MSIEGEPAFADRLGELVNRRPQVDPPLSLNPPRLQDGLLLQIKLQIQLSEPLRIQRRDPRLNRLQLLLLKVMPIVVQGKHPFVLHY